MAALVGGGDGAGRRGCPGIVVTADRFHRGDTADGGGEGRASCCLQSRSTESKRLKLPVELSRNSESVRIWKEKKR